MKKKIKICIVMSMYNTTDHLLDRAIKELKKNHIDYLVINVPGAFEIPVMIARNIKKFDGFIAIGSIIKGQTPNFDFISKAITCGIMQLSILHKKPIGNSIITCLNERQAEKRAGKGKEAARAVLEVLKWHQ